MHAKNAHHSPQMENVNLILLSLLAQFALTVVTINAQTVRMVVMTASFLILKMNAWIQSKIVIGAVLNVSLQKITVMRAVFMIKTKITAINLSMLMIMPAFIVVILSILQSLTNVPFLLQNVISIAQLLKMAILALRIVFGVAVIVLRNQKDVKNVKNMSLLPKLTFKITIPAFCLLK